MKYLASISFVLLLLCVSCSTDKSPKPESLDGTQWTRVDNPDTLFLEFENGRMKKWDKRVGSCYEVVFNEIYEFNDNILTSLNGVFEVTQEGQFLILSDDDVDDVWQRNTFNSKLFDTCSIIGDAWQSFEAKQYVTAHQLFVSVAHIDPENAYTGLGWTTIKMDSLASAKRYFSIIANDSVIDAYAGQAIVDESQKAYSSMISNSDFVLRKNPNWVFYHDQTICYKALILKRASSYFALGNYGSSLTEVQKLDPSFNVDVATSAGQASLAAKIDSFSIGC